MAEEYSIARVYRALFIRLLMDTWVVSTFYTCVDISTIVNNAAMNTGMWASI